MKIAVRPRLGSAAGTKAPKKAKGEAMKKVLCVCKGNSDRSPLMEAVLRKYLRDAGHSDVVVESAGILEYTAKGGRASSYIMRSAGRIGIDLSAHNQRWVGQIADNAYDLYVVVDSEVAEAVLNVVGWDKIGKIYNAEINNPWPSIHQRDYDETAKRILAGMYEVVVRYFSPTE